MIANPATVSLTVSEPSKTGVCSVTLSVPGGASITDRFNIVSEKARSRFIDTACSRFPGLPKTNVQQLLNDEAARITAAVTTQEPPTKLGVDSAALLEAMPSKTRTEAEAMLRDPRLVIQIVDDIQQLGVVGDKPLVLTLYLVGTSRLLDRPLSCIVQGPSSSGKSYPIETIARMMPHEQVIMAKQMTPQALFHMEPGAFVHKFIVAGERSRMENDDQAEATRALRELISTHKLSKLMPTKNGNKIETVLIEQDGPIAFIESTTLSQTFEEDANRCILLQTDERPEQTKRILECIGTKYANGSDKTSSATILDRHHALQRILQPSPVIIPFALKIIEKFPSDRVEARRAITHMFSMVSVIALLHQLQRDRDADGQIIARSEDYAIAVRLLDEPLSRFLGCRISPAALRFHLRLQASFSFDEFTSKQADERENVTSRAVSGWLRELANHSKTSLAIPLTHIPTTTKPHKTNGILANRHRFPAVFR